MYLSSENAGSVVRQLRETRGVSQKELAAMLGMTQGFVSLLESGSRNTSLRAFLSVLEALDTVVDVRLREEVDARL